MAFREKRPLPQRPLLVRATRPPPTSSASTQNTPSPKRAGSVSLAMFPLLPSATARNPSAIPASAM